jgi:hypothetical protein
VWSRRRVFAGGGVCFPPHAVSRVPRRVPQQQAQNAAEKSFLHSITILFVFFYRQETG